MKNKNSKTWQAEPWYSNLSIGGKDVADRIFKYHEKFSKKDKVYRHIVRILKILILFLAMCGTIVLGLKAIVDSEIPVIIGLCVSALVTFLTAISSFFNLEVYWVRNIRKHIQVNLLRDSFVYEAKCQALTQDRIDYYHKEIKYIIEDNKVYWERNINK